MAPADARSARERKQKIFVIVGGLFLFALLAFQIPKLIGGSDSTAAATTGPTTPAGETTPAFEAVPVAVVLADTDRRLAAGPGQLRSFGTFTRKDPFVQQIVTPSPGGEAPATSDAPSDDVPKGSEEAPSKGFSVDGTAAVSVTVISVNGTRQMLEPGTAFPAADPVFVLVAERAGEKSVVIGVAGGAYANGDRTTKLKVGKPVVLVNTATGARYRLVLVAVGNGEASSAEGAAKGAPKP